MVRHANKNNNTDTGKAGRREGRQEGRKQGRV